jgi:hypothetical protein
VLVASALALDCGDFDADKSILTVRMSKGSKSRIIPLHGSSALALRRYASVRDSIYVKRMSPAFFVWEGGDRLVYDSVNRWFLLVACQIGLRKPGDSRGPRVHDLRHYFAIRTLLNWYRIDITISEMLGGFDTPARVPYQTRVIETMVKRENFGADKVPDLLFINYKTIDTIGHAFTINSPEMSDAVSYQDTYLKVLIDFLNRQVGKGKWAMVLTADHGHQYSPTYTAPSRPNGAWQIDVTHMEQDINQHFAVAGSDGNVIEKMRPTQVWLNTDMLAQRGFTVADVASYMMTLTQQDTTKRSTTPKPGHADDPVFKSVVPLQQFDKLPCLPQGEAP